VRVPIRMVIYCKSTMPDSGRGRLMSPRQNGKSSAPLLFCNWLIYIYRFIYPWFWLVANQDRSKADQVKALAGQINGDDER
ncbi:MAG: hypothetical protein ACLQF2_16890, partial [Rhodomicrobium sp.]